MTILQIFMFMFIILPGILFRTIWEMLAQMIDESAWYWNILYMVFLILIVIAIVLWGSGLR